MADYDFSKPAPDRSRRDSGSGAGGLGFILAGAAIILVVLYAVFGGAAVPLEQDPSALAPPAAPAAAGDGVVAPAD